MARPYVSARRLVNNSLSAMLAAIEVYNKPRVDYRDEVTVVLIVNAWELALKAALRQAGASIFYRKRRAEPYRTLAAEDALKQVVTRQLFPATMGATAFLGNITALIEYRNRAIHLYSADLGEVVHPFLQTSVLNYRDFMLDRFNRDLADQITWQLLPLGAKAPDEPIQFMKSDPATSTAAEVQDFLRFLRGLLDESVEAGADTRHFAAIYDVHLQSAKAISKGDLVVSVSTEGEKIVLRKTDPNQTHPFTMTQLLERVNAKRAKVGKRQLKSHDHKVLCWKEGLRDQPEMAWKHSGGSSYVWSGKALDHMVKLGDDYYDAVRVEYQSHQKKIKGTEVD